MKQLHSTVNNEVQILTIKYHAQTMSKILRELQAYCELIIFTYLPREMCEELINSIPDIKSIFSFVLCKEDAVVHD